MNRQFRRAQEKQDKRQEKEKTKRRSERRQKLNQLRASRRKAKEAGSKSEAGKGEAARGTGGEADSQPDSKTSRRRMPGRFSGVLTLVTVFFITLQGAAPAEDQGLGGRLIAAGFYLMLAYFGTLWFMRRQVPRAPVMAVVGGVLVGVSVVVAALIQNREVDLIALGLALPALAVGAWLGRLVFVATPR